MSFDNEKKPANYLDEMPDDLPDEYKELVELAGGWDAFENFLVDDDDDDENLPFGGGDNTLAEEENEPTPEEKAEMGNFLLDLLRAMHAPTKAEREKILNRAFQSE